MKSLARCPHCRARLPLWPSLWSSDLICPRCHSELAPRRGTLIVPLAAGISASIYLRTRLRGIGLDWPADMLVDAGVFVIVCLPAYALLGRFRPKPKPPSIL